MIGKLRREQEKKDKSSLSRDWRDLMDDDEEIVDIFSKKSIPLIIFNLFALVMFSSLIIIAIIINDFSQKSGLLMSLFLVVYSSGGIINVNSKLIITNKSLIIKGVFLSRRLYLKKITLEKFSLERFKAPSIFDPSRYYFKIRYNNKDYQYPTWRNCGFPYKLGRKKYEEIIKYVEEAKN